MSSQLFKRQQSEILDRLIGLLGPAKGGGIDNLEKTYLWWEFSDEKKAKRVLEIKPDAELVHFRKINIYELYFY